MWPRCCSSELPWRCPYYLLLVLRRRPTTKAPCHGDTLWAEMSCCENARQWHQICPPHRKCACEHTCRKLSLKSVWMSRTRATGIVVWCWACARSRVFTSSMFLMGPTGPLGRRTIASTCSLRPSIPRWPLPYGTGGGRRCQSMYPE